MKLLPCWFVVCSLFACAPMPVTAPSVEATTATCGAQLDSLTEACRTCALAACRGELSTCCEANGCIPVVACSARTGCVHGSCYDSKTCKAEVDAAGGITGLGTARGSDLGTCIEDAAKQNATCASCRM